MLPVDLQYLECKLFSCSYKLIKAVIMEIQAFAILPINYLKKMFSDFLPQKVLQVSDWQTGTHTHTHTHKGIRNSSFESLLAWWKRLSSSQRATCFWVLLPNFGSESLLQNTLYKKYGLSFQSSAGSVLCSSHGFSATFRYLWEIWGFSI